MKKLIILVGKCAVGKTCLEKVLNELYGVQRGVSYTTRPPRSCEVNHVDYHFISNEEFDEMLKRNEFFEMTEYYVNGEKWRYGLATGSFIKDAINVTTVNPEGLIGLSKHIPLEKLKVFKIISEDSTRVERYLKRENYSPKAVKNLSERLTRDEEDFDVKRILENSNIPFERIFNEKDRTLDSVASEIYKRIF